MATLQTLQDKKEHSGIPSPMMQERKLEQNMPRIRQSVEYAKECCERNISVIRENVIVVRIIAPSFTGWYDLSALGD